VTELVGIDCVNGVIMYNVTTAAAMIAVAQQAIKKAPVTSTFPEGKPQAGLAMWINYGRFSMIGQAFLIIPSSVFKMKERDDGFSSDPILHNSYARASFYRYSSEWISVVPCSFCTFPDGKEASCLQVWLLVVPETKKARYWQYLAFVNYLSELHNSLRFRCYQHLQHHDPIGEGEIVPRCSFQGEE
jgi:hypothetical protein